MIILWLKKPKQPDFKVSTEFYQVENGYEYRLSDTEEYLKQKIVIRSHIMNKISKDLFWFRFCINRTFSVCVSSLRNCGRNVCWSLPFVFSGRRFSTAMCKRKKTENSTKRVDFRLSVATMNIVMGRTSESPKVWDGYERKHYVQECYCYEVPYRLLRWRFQLTSPRCGKHRCRRHWNSSDLPA